MNISQMTRRVSITTWHWFAMLAILAAVASAAERDWREGWFEFIDKGDISGLRQMIEKGADVNAKDRRGQTGLIIASSKGCDPVVDLLLKA